MNNKKKGISGLLKGGPVFGPLLSKKIDTVKKDKEENTEVAAQVKSDDNDTERERSREKEKTSMKDHQSDSIKDTNDERVDAPAGSTTNSKKTKAELSFNRLKDRRLVEQVDNKLQLSYRQRIELLNKHLNELPINFDIPRVGPG